MMTTKNIARITLELYAFNSKLDYIPDFALYALSKKYDLSVDTIRKLRDVVQEKEHIPETFADIEAQISKEYDEWMKTQR